MLNYVCLIFIGVMGYGLHLLNGMRIINRQLKPCPKNNSCKYFSCSQSLMRPNHYWLYPSLQDELILRMRAKPAGVDNHMGSFAGLMDFVINLTGLHNSGLACMDG